MQPSYTTYESKSTAKLIATILTVVVIAGVVLMVDHIKAEATQAASTQQAPTTSQVSVTPAPTTSSTTGMSSMSGSSTMKSGNFTASSSYYVPNGYESIKVTLTVQDGVITNSSVRNSQGDPTSAAYQQDFASSYKSYVVGKQISGLRLGVIAGASDTSKGFEAALSQIASQTQA